MGEMRYHLDLTPLTCSTHFTTQAGEQDEHPGGFRPRDKNIHGGNLNVTVKTGGVIP